MCGFIGIHTMPPDQALVPPTVSAFSNSPTLAPPAEARIAALSAAAPVPRTMTSNVSTRTPSRFTAGVFIQSLHKDPSHGLPRSLASISALHATLQEAP